MHIQDAFVVDQQRAGTFAEIGYEEPVSTVFTYTDNNKSFKADAGGKLDKCGDAAAQLWTVGVTVNSTTKKASYTPSDNCPALTPNFKNIGSSAGS